MTIASRRFRKFRSPRRAKRIAQHDECFVADGLVHIDATALLQSKTPSNILDSGLRDALGRHAGTLQNLSSIESTKPIRDRLYLALTGTTAHTPLHCILSDMNTIDNNEHARICPALIHHRQLRFLLMAEAFASIGDTLHHRIVMCERLPASCQRCHTGGRRKEGAEYELLPSPFYALHRLCPLALRLRAGRLLSLWLFVLRKIQRCRGAGACL